MCTLLFVFMIKDRGNGLTPGCTKLLNNVEKSQLVANIQTHQTQFTSRICTLLIYTSKKQTPPVCVSVYMSHVHSTPAALKTDFGGGQLGGRLRE